MKICTKCKTKKELSKFYYRKDTNSYRNECKKCIIEDRKKYRKQNGDKISKQRKAKYKEDPNKYDVRSKIYQSNNREYFYNYRKKYYLNNKDKVKEQNRLKYEKNKEAIKSNQRDYYRKNIEKIKIYNKSEAGRERARRGFHKRRASIISTCDGTVTKESLQRLRVKQNNKCYDCNCRLDFKAKNKVHLDHRIPLSKGGIHSITNVVYLCKRCNLTKSNTYSDNYTKHKNQNILYFKNATT